MKKVKKKWIVKENVEGAIALEACIALTIFMIVMFSLYSMICMFTAQSMISHALQQAGQSLALEKYKNEKLKGIHIKWHRKKNMYRHIIFPPKAIWQPEPLLCTFRQSSLRT